MASKQAAVARTETLYGTAVPPSPSAGMSNTKASSTDCKRSGRGDLRGFFLFIGFTTLAEPKWPDSTDNANNSPKNFYSIQDSRINFLAKGNFRAGREIRNKKPTQRIMCTQNIHA